MASHPEDARAAALAANLAALRNRIAAAAAAAGRDPAALTLVAVTKTFPAADVLRLARLGVRDVGENRDQEAAPKVAAVAAATTPGVAAVAAATTPGVAAAAEAAAAAGPEPPAVRWHFVGRLQRNKCRSVAGYADLVHSVDSVRLARALSAAATPRDRRVDVLVQVSLDGDLTRGGALAADLPGLADAVAGEPALRLRGVMAVRPLAAAPEAAFAELARLADRIRADHPEATVLSAGMSDDLEPAVACGATHLRIGSALLGRRDPVR